MKLVAILSFGLFLLPAASSCKKVEGEGGSSSIRGTIIVNKYNSVGTLIAEYVAMKEDIYIVYGTEDMTYDDKTETSYDGTFEFKYLQPGTYTVFAYEDCNTCASGKKAVVTTVTIDKKKSKIDLGEIIIREQ